MSGKAAILDLLREAEAAGFTVRLTRGGHYMIRDPAGRYVCMAGASTSDRKAHHNVRAALRRAGLPR